MTDIAPRPVRLLLDTAEVEAWRRWLPTGVLAGVTTNPLLLERAGMECTLDRLDDLTAEAAALGAREIHLQTWGPDAATMTATGLKLAAMADGALRVLVKVPATEEGLRAAHTLRAKGCAITLTAVFNPGQVMAASTLGADYAAPYLGRMLDDGRDGMLVVRTMHKILRRTASATRLLCASLRDPEQVTALAAAGLDTFTVAPRILEGLLTDDLTARAEADFNRAAQGK